MFNKILNVLIGLILSFFLVEIVFDITIYFFYRVLGRYFDVSDALGWFVVAMVAGLTLSVYLCFLNVGDKS